MIEISRPIGKPCLKAKKLILNKYCLVTQHTSTAVSENNTILLSNSKYCFFFFRGRSQKLNEFFQTLISLSLEGKISHHLMLSLDVRVDIAL